MRKIELLSPAGDFERLEAAVHFGCNAVYFAGKKYGLRAFSNNFEEEEIAKAVIYCHEHNVKVYITVNILAHNEDFKGLREYLEYLDKVGVDGVIVSDLGIASYVKAYTKLELHVSTQANITNIETAKMWVKLGAKRLVLARELSLKEIKDIKEAVGEEIDIECFCHGAMCISYSGRCLLSNYFIGRDSNKGACAQPCRWGYSLLSRDGRFDVPGEYPIMEDERGTYIMNSKDLCLIEHIKELIDAGITSFKIEGRMKTSYYVATTTNAYRRAIDAALNNENINFNAIEELEKTSHRHFTTGFYFNSDEKTYIKDDLLLASYEFVAKVIGENKENKVLVEIRNKFKKEDTLEVLSPDLNFNKEIIINNIFDSKNGIKEVASGSKEHVYIETDLLLKPGDILRKKKII